MDKFAPFSITPDAEDYIRNRLSVMPPKAEPVIILATRLGEPLDGHGKKTRWLHEGENFDVCCFDPTEKLQTEQIELLGRNFSITPEALKHLAGRKYVGYGGLSSQLDWWIFIGIPLPLTIVLVMFLEHFAHTINQKTIAVFAGIVIVFVPAMYLCDRIKHQIVIWLGLFG